MIWIKWAAQIIMIGSCFFLFDYRIEKMEENLTKICLDLQDRYDDLQTKHNDFRDIIKFFTRVSYFELDELGRSDKESEGKVHTDSEPQ